MPSTESEVIAFVRCRKADLLSLNDLAASVDRAAKVSPPPDGYDVGHAFCAVMNGGTVEDIQAALGLVTGWSFEPKEGWLYQR